MKKIIQNSISKKLLASVLVVSSVITLIVTGIQLAFDYHQDVSAIEVNLNMVTRSHLDGISKSLWDLDNSFLKAQLSGIIDQPSIQFVEIVDPHHNIILKEGARPSGDVISFEYPLHYTTARGEVHLGQIRVMSSLDEVWNKMYQKAFFIFLAQFVKTVVVSFLILMTINHLLTKHLLKITRYISTTDFRKKSESLVLNRKEQNQDELTLLVNSINNMHKELFHSYQKLSDFNHQLEEKVQEKTRIVIEQRQKLEQSSKLTALGEMAAGIAHEINNPLGIIRLKSDWLRRQISSLPHSQDHVHELDRINHTVERIASIIKNLRAFAQNNPNESFQTVPLQKIVESTLQLCRESSHRSGIQFRFPQSDENLFVDCKPVSLSQALMNLLLNGKEAVENRSERWIEISTYQDNDFAYLRVTDSGPGIPYDLRSKILQPFFTTKTIGKGPGLGLSVAVGITKEHDGDLYLDEKSPHTSFVIKLPLRQLATRSQAA